MARQGSDLRAVEDWTPRITEINSEASRSRSRRVAIESRDWMLADIMKTFKQTAPPPVGYEVKWSVLPQSTDTYKPEPAREDGKVYPSTLAQGPTHGVHTLEIIPNGDGPVPIEAIPVYRPPLK